MDYKKLLVTDEFREEYGEEAADETEAYLYSSPEKNQGS